MQEKTRNENIKVFAGFELAETMVMTSVLKDLGTILPVMNEESKAAFTEIESGDAGPELDKSYIDAQLKNHRFLRDLTEEYLKEAPTGNLDKEESQVKYFAKLSLLIFNEHIAIAEGIKKELTGEK